MKPEEEFEAVMGREEGGSGETLVGERNMKGCCLKSGTKSLGAGQGKANASLTCTGEKSKRCD